MVVDIFIPCFIDQIYPETGMNMVKILEKVGCGVNYNPEQTCCGQPAYNSGYWKEAEEIAKKFLADFHNNRPIVTPSASCAGFVKNHYPEMFHNTGFHYECKQTRQNLIEFTDFLVNTLQIKDLGVTFKAKVTFHDSCAALREYKLNDEPRQLLRHVRGLEMIEMEENDVCCGFGGTFSAKFEPISVAMAEQKVENALKTGAEYIVSTESSCLMHLNSYIAKQKLSIKTIHIVDLLASNL